MSPDSHWPNGSPSWGYWRNAQRQPGRKCVLLFQSIAPEAPPLLWTDMVTKTTNKTIQITFRGQARDVMLLAQLLDEEGVRVAYRPPVERRNAQEFARDVVVDLTASGMGAAITLAVQRFHQRVMGRSTARIEDEDDD